MLHNVKNNPKTTKQNQKKRERVCLMKNTCLRAGRYFKVTRDTNSLVKAKKASLGTKDTCLSLRYYGIASHVITTYPWKNLLHSVTLKTFPNNG